MNVGIILAGGTGTRMKNARMPKQFMELNGKPILIYTLEHFENHNDIDAMVIACNADWIEHLKELLKRFRITKVNSIIPGGSTGHMSRYLGLKKAMTFCDKDDVAVIHDGVRPIINEEIITQNIISAKKFGSAITCVQCQETIVESTSTTLIDNVHIRDNQYIGQCPQSFRLGEIFDLHQKYIDTYSEDSTDACSVMVHFDKPVYRVEGIYSNLKITTPKDFLFFKSHVERMEANQLGE